MTAEEGDPIRQQRPARPKISLPPRSAFGFVDSVSPGPMTLVSRLFTDDADPDCQSFSQLLAGVIASSPIAKAPSPLFTVPPGLSPAGLLDSPAFFAVSPGAFGISHQEALAQVTAQAASSNSQMYMQSASPESAATAVSLTQPAPTAGNPAFGPEISLHSKDVTGTVSFGDCPYSEQRSQPASFNASKPADDGYNWRKYGQKQVKKSEFPRSYYKCTFPNCSVTKKVEHALDGQVTEIIYKGQHNHERPLPSRRTREVNTFSMELNGISDMTEASSNSQPQKFRKSNIGHGLISKRDEESDQAAAEHLSGSSDEEVANAEYKIDEADEAELHITRSNGAESGMFNSVSSQKTLAEPRIIVQTTSEVDLLDDGYKWRKYGQKVVKGNPNPRSYYRCTFPGCNVRKHVERASTDLRDVITTYEGKHNHDAPTARGNSHNAVSSSSNIIQPKAMHAAKTQQPAIAGLQLKEEYRNL